MPDMPYLSSVNVKAYVNGWWLDDVVEVRYSVVDEKAPIYGFRSQLFDGVAYGKTRVDGVLVCQFRYPGYLTKVLDEIIPVDEQIGSSTKDTGVTLTEALAKQHQEDLKKMLAHLGATDISKFQAVKKNLVYLFQKPKRNTQMEVPRAGIYQSQRNLRFDLRLTYGRSDDDSSFRFDQVIQDVLLTSQGQSVSVLDGGGDTCLVEQYTFIARNVISTQ